MYTPEDIESIRNALKSILEPDYIDTWLETPNEGFCFKSPREVIEEGNADRIYDMIYHVETGSYM